MIRSTMAITIAVESVDQLAQDDLLPLMQAHNLEVATFPELQVLDPDIDMFRSCEKVGMYFGIVARDEQGRPIGYTGTFINRHRFSRTWVFANNDMLFVAKPYRGTTLAFRLMRATVAEAKRRGAKLMGWSAKPGSALANMLTRLGHVPEETLYLKAI